MPQICDMGQTALLPLRRKACWGFFSPLKIRRLRSGLNPRTWVPKASTLPLDHRSRFNYRNTEKIWPAAFQDEILEDWRSIPTVISPLNPPGNFMWLKYFTYTKYKYYIRAYWWVSYDFQNKDKIFTVSLCILSHSIFSVPNNAQYIHF